MKKRHDVEQFSLNPTSSYSGLLIILLLTVALSLWEFSNSFKKAIFEPETSFHQIKFLITV